MSEVGRILSQAGRDVGGAIGGIGETAIETVIRIEQLRQQEQRSQLDLFSLMQRQQVSALQLANAVRQMDLLEGQIGLAGRRFTQEQLEWTAGEHRRDVELAIREAQRRQEEAQAAMLEEALPSEEEEDKGPGIGARAVETIKRVIKPTVVREEPITWGEIGEAIKGAIPEPRVPATYLGGYAPPGILPGQRPPSPAKEVTPMQMQQIAPEVERAGLFEVPEQPDVTDISLEEQNAARAAFQQEINKLSEDVREQLRKGVGLEALKDLLRRTAQSTANIRRRNL